MGMEIGDRAVPRRRDSSSARPGPRFVGRRHVWSWTVKRLDVSGTLSILGVALTVAASVFVFREGVSGFGQVVARDTIIASVIAMLTSVGTGFLAGTYSRSLARTAKRLSRQPRVFLSYPHSSKASALDIADILRKSGAHVWLDFEHISAGDAFEPAITRALDSTDSLVVLLHGKTSLHLKQEIRLAKDRGIQIVPIVLGSAEIPKDLRNVRHLDFSEKPFSSAELVKAIS